jgi:uncharacterized oligopeptide transporter (OPT) family protein
LTRRESSKRVEIDPHNGQLSRNSNAAAVAAGALIGPVLAAGNVYMGLKIGFTVSGSIVAAIAAVFAVRALTRRSSRAFTPLHTNLIQTGASAGAFCAVAGLTNAVPAMRLAGVSADPWLLVPWVLFLSLLGVCIAVPLRRRAIDIDTDELKFPSGVACAETIQALHADDIGAQRKGRVLAASAIVGGVVTWIREAGLPWLGKILPVKTLLPGTLGAVSCERLGLGIAWSPLLFAVGGIVGLRVALSLALGSTLGFAVAGPWLAARGVIEVTGPQAVVLWTVWPAVGLMAAGGIGALVAGGGVFRRALSLVEKAPVPGRHADRSGAVPRIWWLGGLVVAAARTPSACAARQASTLFSIVGPGSRGFIIANGHRSFSGFNPTPERGLDSSTVTDSVPWASYR